MKDNIFSLECINCGIYIYPPSEISDVGEEDYVVIYALPQLTQDQIPTEKDLEKINTYLKMHRKNTVYSKDNWIADYNNWLSAYKNDLKNKAEQRVQEIQNKVVNVRIVEENDAIKIIGKRYKAKLQVFENGWRLKCPNCGFTLVECWW
jgi:NDP-sugar pyrophosphorylase family protein